MPRIVEGAERGSKDRGEELVQHVASLGADLNSPWNTEAAARVLTLSVALHGVQL